MSATREAILGQLGGTSWANAIPQVGGPAQNIDILQIVDEGGSVLLNVDYAGTVHNPASSATGNNTRCGQFRTLLSSGTTAALFASAFTNPDNSDILQVVSQGGNIANYLDYLGVSH